MGVMKMGIFEEPKVHCWRTQHELRIRQPLTPTSVEIDFSTRAGQFLGLPFRNEAPWQRTGGGDNALFLEELD
jgi:hypothetical protein